MLKNTLCGICVLFFVLFTTGPKQVDAREKLKVSVSVTVDDKSTKNLFESYLKRELRSLQDVEIGEAKHAPYYELSVIAVEPVYAASGQKTGRIAIAYVFTHRFDPSILVPHIPEEHQVNVIVETLFLYYEPIVGCYEGGRQDIPELCRELVAKFDIEILEPVRQKKN